MRVWEVNKTIGIVLVWLICPTLPAAECHIHSKLYTEAAIKRMRTDGRLTNSAWHAVRHDLERRADQGDATATVDLGLLYELGPGALRDERKALQYYLRAALAGDQEGQYSAGMLLAHGPIELRDVASAVKLLGRAADQGDQRATAELATMTHQTQALASLVMR